MTLSRIDTGSRYAPYAPRLAAAWARERPEDLWQSLEGSLVFVDISGFTALSERLAKRGPVGAEELTEVISNSFAALLSDAYAEGGSLLKFGGDALLLMFDGSDHPDRATRAALQMRSTMRNVGHLTTSVGKVRLRMSVGIHSGEIHLFRVGNSHKELIICGPSASHVVAMESTADAGEIVVSPDTAAQLERRLVGDAKGPGFLLRDRRLPPPGTTHPPPPDTSESTAMALPVALRELLATGAAESEHRHASIAFLHFDGTDELLESQGPDAVAAALEELVVDVQAAADDQGVTFLATDVDHDGGKIILVAGVPSAFEDDEGRLLRAVRAIADGDRVLPLRIGVNRGPIFAGEVGPAYRRTYTVMGDAVNLAARIMAKAAPGQALASAGVLERSRTAFETTALEPFFVKGKTAPVTAFAIGPALGPREQRSSSRLPLTGRDVELETLIATLDEAVQGHGRVVELVGEAGLGKTRLLEELWATAANCAGGPVDLRLVQCEQYESTTPYFSARLLLQAMLRLPPGAGEADLVAIIETRSPALLPWVPLLGDALDIAVAETDQTLYLAPRFRRQRTAIAVAEALMADEGRTLIAFDDIQWMDDASAEVVARMAATIADRPWLLCLTRRPGGRDRVFGTDTTTLTLEPLKDDAAAALVAAGTAERPLPPVRRAELVARSGGNPLFLEELLRLSAGVASGDDTALPESVEGVLIAQIDALPPDTRRVLRYAAVLGSSFEVPLLEAAFGSVLDFDIPAAARRLGEHLLTEPDGRLRFRHRLLRDVAYETLSFRKRQQLHRLAGEAIEAIVGADAADERAAVLSLHFYRAQDWDRAWEYGRRAGERARAKFANVEATDLLQRAIDASRHVKTVDGDAIASAWEALGSAANMASVFPLAKRAFSTAAALYAEDPIALAKLYRQQAGVAERTGNRLSAVRWIGRGLRALSDIEDEEARRQRAELLVQYAWTRHGLGRLREAQRLCEEALAEAERSGNKRAKAEALWLLDSTNIDLGRPELATHGRSALELYEELGEHGELAVLLNNLGAFEYRRGRWSEALTMYQRACDALERIGDALFAAIGACNVAEIFADQGDLAEAERLLLEAINTSRSLDVPFVEAMATRHLGKIRLRSGQLDDARALLTAARATFSAVGLASKVLEVDVWLAEATLRDGRAEEVIEQLTDLLARCEALGSTEHVPTIRRLNGYAAASAGRLIDAWAELDLSLDSARRVGAEYEVALTLEAMAVVAELGGSATAPGADAERRGILAALDVRATPPPPIGSVGADGSQP